MNEEKTFKNAADAYNALSALLREARGMQGDLRTETRAAKRILDQTVEDRVEEQLQSIATEMWKAVNAALDTFYKELAEKQREAVKKMEKEIDASVTREIQRLLEHDRTSCACSHGPSIVIDAR